MPQLTFFLAAVFFSYFVSSNTANAVTDTVVIKGMDRPWAVVATPEGNIAITQKFKGNVLLYDMNFKSLGQISGFPDFSGSVEGGILDLAFHPRYAENKWMYIVYTVKGSAGHRIQVNRFKLAGTKLTERKIILEGPEAAQSHHFGSRLLFDREGNLLITIGERYLKEKAQDMKSLLGKIVRVTEDGKVPSSNPFQGSVIYSLGHRNPQGLALNPQNGRIYSSEHGPSGFDAPGGGDELNEIIPGGNYGWPMYHHGSNAPGFIAPLVEFPATLAPSGIAFYTGHKIPAWKNDLFVTGLRGQQLVRIRLNSAGAIASSEVLLQGKYGRIRDVESSPDGSLLVLSEDGRLIQIQ